LNVLSYIACPRYPYIRVYRLYDTIFCCQHGANQIAYEVIH